MRFRAVPATICFALALALSACGRGGDGSQQSERSSPAKPAATPLTIDAMLSHDPVKGAQAGVAANRDTARPLMQAQVVLERLGFAPGVVDDREGLSTRNAVTGFQEANGLQKTGELDDRTRAALAPWNAIPATRMITIPPDFAAGPFAPIPASPAEQARLPALGYQSLDEKLAERFHTTIETLKGLNPEIAGPPTPSGTPSPTTAASTATIAPIFRAGQTIRVPNVGGDHIAPSAVKDEAWRDTMAALGVGTDQPRAQRLVVSKSKGTLSVFDRAGRLVALFTATIGSSHDPLPLGRWKVLGTSYNPKFHYNPKLFWDASDKASKEVLPAGPNGPVGVVWIDLNKPHYGIHGTPEPQAIGRAESHGCVRLTNWDAARLAQMVMPGTEVLFAA